MAIESRNQSFNFLFIIVDEQRFPTVYENKEIKEWRKQNLKSQEILCHNGMTFLNHYIGSSACSPSRTTLFTGQYPSLHGVTQTTGAAKKSFDPDMFWLDHNTVPTVGNYFQKAGYRTFYKGKWHISDEDIITPGTHHPIASYHPNTGIPDRKKEKIYEQANRLSAYGFDGWIGPEPHGSNPHNSGSSSASTISGRDEVYAEEVVQLIRELDKEDEGNEQKPWMIVSSFVNPHDIALFGDITQLLPTFHFEIDPSVPFIPPAPTANEDLLTKPSAQGSYREVFPQALQPTSDTITYRQLYYSLQKKVDEEIYKVLRALQNSRYYQDTIVIYTADHGSLVGAHGGLFQKWHNAYEETLHVPLIIHNPKLFKQAQDTTIITSHVDIIPTLLGIANIEVSHVQKELKRSHTEVHPLVGKDLSPLLYGKTNFSQADAPIYFMTDDEISKGLNQVSLLGKPYSSVNQPNHLETIIVRLPTGDHKALEIWKFTRYFDNPQFWSKPYVEDTVSTPKKSFPLTDNSEAILSLTTTKTSPVADQFELYNLTKDSIEQFNLADPLFATEHSKIVYDYLYKLLQQQAKQKRLYPAERMKPGDIRAL